jgi:hypothetical protein
MNRSAGVTVIAVLSLIGSALMLLMGSLMAVMIFFAPTPEAQESPVPPLFFKALFLLMACMFLLPAIWGIVSSIGLFLLKNWARISTIVFSALLALLSGLQAIVSLIMPFPTVPNFPIDNPAIVAVRMFIAAVFIGHLGIGIWWLLFFTRPKVAQQFKRTPLMATAETLPPMAQPMQVSTAPARPVSRSRRPASITVIACLLLAGCLFMPLSIVTHAPVVLFAAMVTGRLSVLIHLIFLAVSLYCGIGLLRLKPAARLTTIGYLIFGAVNMIVFYFAPGGSARIRALMNIQQSMFPWLAAWQDQSIVRFDPAPFIVIGALSGLIMFAIAMYFLITRKKAYLAAAAELRSSKIE